MILNRTISAGLLAATVVVTALSGATTESRAGSLSPGEAAAIAGLGGFIVGGLIADSRNRYYGPAPVYGRAHAWDRHVARCYARYRSYDEYSDSYLGFDGYRHRCRL
ncbi:BA14K family protein [Nitratireductor sp. ZSWI3]|uniref:BA14K family protein n=1 Tax=Nitratireductor sp. ZSWI3 TaxID=2966359 RepID=UPI00214F7925|nr:BA14K family protein [Nitratireductor sp. ZSWI3]MCR4268528.1 BA14K family protein [Nitratireductor sp. ZSWI3]